MKNTGAFFVLLILAAGCLAQFDCFKAPASPQDRRPNKSQLIIGTYNVEFLMLNASFCPDPVNCDWHDASAATQHLNAVAAQIKKLNADVLNLVETQDCYVLGQLIKAIGDNTYKPYLVKGTDTTTDQNVALLTRIDPVVDLQRYQPSGSDLRVSIPVTGSNCGSTVTTTTAVSKHYYTKLVVDSMNILLIGAHFVAYPTLPDRCAQREGQAQIIAQIIQKEGIAKGNEVIFFGDLNDFDDVIPDVDSNVPKSMVLKTLKATGVSSVMTKADVSTRYSVWYDSNGDCVVRVPQEVSVIDHVLLTPKLFSKVSNLHYGHDLYTKTCTNYESDHWPVTFSLAGGGSGGNSTSSSGKSHKGVIIAVVVILDLLLLLIF